MKKGVLWPYIWKYKYHYILGLFTLFIVDYFNLYIPQITGEITDGLASFSLTLPDILKLVFALIFVAGVISIGRIGWRFFIFGTCRKIENELRNSMFQKLETLSQNYFNSHKTGDLMTNFTNDLDALREAIGPAVISAFDATLMTVMTLTKMIRYIDLRLTLLTLIPMSIIAVGGYYFGEAFERRFSRKQKSFAKLSDFVQESITGERVIKAFVQEKKQGELFEEVNQANKKSNMQVVTLMASVIPVLDFIIGASYVITIIFGGYLAITGQITLGKFIAFSQYIGLLIWPMIAFGESITMFSQGRAAVDRINQIFAEIPDIVDDENAIYIDTLNGNITFENVNFAYGKGLPDAISGLNIDIKQGETFAILGKTGSGKTTLVNLLMRLYDINQGNIKVDGHELKKVPLQVLRKSIAYVPQDNYLFSDTLENNIIFGKVGASHEDVVEACKDACVHDNIIDFKEGYQTVVGERGVTLSGGQKQRCSIARALMKDSPILILDDALSAVDTDTEDRILENLKQKRQNKTTIMIAHRISTVKNADHILVLEDGKEVEYGTFDELIANNGLFKEMYDKQQLEKQLSNQE